MLKKNKKSLLLVSGLAGALITSTAAGVALSSCTTTSSSSNSSSSYSYVIDWSDRNLVNRLVVDENGLVYSDNSKTTIIALSPNVQITNITIPSTVKHIAGYSRVGVDSTGTKTYTSVGAFQDMDSLISITLETGTKLQSIGASAFYNCANLMAINGDTSSLMTVGASAFYGCLQLKSINLNNVQSIGASAFYGCTGLSGTFDLSNTLIIGASAFSGAFSSTEETSITMNNMLTIGDSAFYQSNITSLTLGTSYAAATIGASAFNGCTKLATVNFISSSNSSSLTIGTSAFSGCTSLATLTFPNSSTTISNLVAIGETAFNGCTSLVSTHLSSVTSIGASAFAGCTKLTTVTLPSNDSSVMTTIGDTAFNGCTLLETVAPLATTSRAQQTGFVSTSTMTSVGASAFQNTAIKTIDLTNFKGTTQTDGFVSTGSTTSFANIPYLASVDLGTAVTIVHVNQGKGLFYNSGLSGEGFDITLSSSIKGINVSGQASAFTDSGVRSIDASKITSYWTGERSNTVMGYMFKNCTKLQEVILKPGTTTIDPNTFTNTPELNTVVIPTNANDNVSNITGFKGSSTLTSFGSGNFTTSNFETIDLTDLSNTTISSIASSFTSLPTGAVVKLPAGFTGTLNTTSFKITTDDSSNVYATVQYPNGVEVPTANITDGKLNAATFLSNISGSLDLSSNASITSIGENTFFGTSLGSLTLAASGISTSTNLFSTATQITTNTSSTAAVTSYTKANVPFGSNTVFTGLNYSTFVAPTTDETPSTPTTRTAQTLFEATTQDTWTKVQKIINSLSNYDYVQDDAVSSPSKLPINLSEWTAEASGTGASKINTDSEIKFTAATTGGTPTAANISLTNTFDSTTDATTEALTINSTDETKLFMHNGILWTYKNDGSSITLTGEANMYKLTSTNTNSNKSYLTFFNTSQVQVQPSEGQSTTYNIPSQAKVSVTLTIATA